MGAEAQMHTEDETTLEGLQKSLADLNKATSALSDVQKSLGNIAIDQGGHTEGTTKTSGGYPEQSDVGGLDSMMIGKMRQSLVDAGYGAAEIAAFMGDDDEDEEDEEEDDGDEGSGEVPQPPFGKMGKPASTEGGVGTNPRAKPTGGKGMQKSMDAFREDPAIAQLVDASEFVEQLVSSTATQIDDVRKSVDSVARGRAQSEQVFAKALTGLTGIVKSQAAIIGEMGRRLGIVESTPNAPKGRTQLPPGAHRPAAPAAGQLSKSHIASVFSYMNLEKKIPDIRGVKTADLATLAECGQVSEGMLKSVQGFLAAHPNEQEAALTYR
jgi:hypothetical protein